MIVIAGCEHRFIVAEQLRAVGLSAGSIVLEPMRRNTLPAATVAALAAIRQDPDALVLLMPADHVIAEPDKFLTAVEAGTPAAQSGAFVLLGVPARSPAASYGYIEIGGPTHHDGVRRVERFIEKPPRDVAERCLARGNFAWNSGIFLLPAAGFLAEVERLAPDVLVTVTEALDRAVMDSDFVRLDPCFGLSPAISIDHAVMERTDKSCVVSVIMLIATRRGINDTFQFRIEPDDAAPTVTSDPVKAARVLFRLGIARPLQLVEHAQHWGSVEIVKQSPLHH